MMMNENKTFRPQIGISLLPRVACSPKGLKASIEFVERLKKVVRETRLVWHLTLVGIYARGRDSPGTGT